MRGLKTATKALSAFICSAAIWATAGTATAADANSGFLPDYSQLQVVKTDKGTELRRWLSPKYQKGVYTQLLVDKVTYYPEPKASAQVSDQALADIQAYMDDQLRNVALKDVPQVTAAGPGVLVVKVAITAVDTSASGLKPWQLVPAALVIEGAKAASGGRAMNARLQVEAIVSDSVTHEPVAMVVRATKGFELKNAKEQLTLDTVKPRLDRWAANAAQFVRERLAKAK